VRLLKKTRCSEEDGDLELRFEHIDISVDGFGGYIVGLGVFFLG